MKKNWRDLDLFQYNNQNQKTINPGLRSLLIFLNLTSNLTRDVLQDSYKISKLLSPGKICVNAFLLGRTSAELELSGLYRNFDDSEPGLDNWFNKAAPSECYTSGSSRRYYIYVPQRALITHFRVFTSNDTSLPSKFRFTCFSSFLPPVLSEFKRRNKLLYPKNPCFCFRWLRKGEGWRLDLLHRVSKLVFHLRRIPIAALLDHTIWKLIRMTIIKTITCEIVSRNLWRSWKSLTISKSVWHSSDIGARLFKTASKFWRKIKILYMSFRLSKNIP